MLFGPMPVVFAEKLRQMLAAQGADAKIYHSQDDLDSFRDEIVNRSPQPYPIFEGTRDLVHIDIEPQFLLIVRGELEKLGFQIPARGSSPILGEDFLCPRCGFHSETEGTCPKHNLQLVTFSNWIEDKKLFTSRRNRIFAWLILLGLAIGELVNVILMYRQGEP